MSDQGTQAERTHGSFEAALSIVDDAWKELQRSPYVQLRLGIALEHLPDISFEQSQRHAECGRALLRSLDGVDSTELPHDLQLTLRLVRFRAQTWSREADWYWNVIDPMGIGFFGLFLPTAYCGGSLLNCVHQQLATFPFSESADTDRYLGLIDEYARLIEQFTARTAGQAARGIYIPKPQVVPSRALLSAFKSRANGALAVAPERLTSIRPREFSREVTDRIATSVVPALDRALEGLSDAYLAQAPASVGIGQYPAGQAVYRELVQLHTTLSLTPEEVHSLGSERLGQIRRSMRNIESEFGCETSDAMLRHLDEDPKWRADTVEGVAATFQRYIDRLKPHVPMYFSKLPRSTYGVAPLPEALQGSMTFGYYDAPTRDRAKGFYLFNPKNLTQHSLCNLAALVYHELVPGHHLHLATQYENPELSPFRLHSFVNAYNEGWAEYAATFAGEIGMYERAEERYGRLVMDAFLTCRLVVDTGMNALGWSLTQARAYMREYSGMTEADILTESLRYSCDMPGQALAYKLGDTQILRMREDMRHALGTQFDLKEFHAAVLGLGALPLPDLQWHVEFETNRLRDRAFAGATGSVSEA